MADDFARQLLDALYNPETQPPQQPSRPLREKLAGAAETAATIGTGLLGSVPAGLAGLTQLIPTRGHRPSVNRAAQKVEDVQSALTYLPRGEAGQEYLEKTAGALGMLGAPAEFLGEQTLKLTGSPFLATAANVALDPVNYIGMPGSGKAAVATGKALGRAAAAAPRVAGEMASDLLMGQGRMEGQRGAIKMKGGNWLAGEVEGVTKPLRKTLDDDKIYLDFLRKDREQGGGFAEWVREKNEQDPSYIRRDALSVVNDYLSELGQPKLQGNPLNRWIDTKLNRYIKNEMATPEDPVRKLAERGISHMQGLDQHEGYVGIGTRTARKKAGLPEKGFGESLLARNWEAKADQAIHPRTAGELSDPDQWISASAYDLHKQLKDNPWLAKLSPETPVYEAAATAENFDRMLGFDHLIDELKNALDPNSDLPARLRYKPEDLEKVTMEQAVRRVHDINEYRAQKKAEANEVLARNPATVTFKEYPSVPGSDKPNEKGLAWKEIKMPEAVLPEGYTARHLPEVDMWGIYDPKGGAEGMGATEREAMGLFRRDERKKALQDALKYEGDVMGHCVGGYCDDVLSGRTQIYSLRDKKGEPHVTIEVGPGAYTPMDIPKDIFPIYMQHASIGIPAHGGRPGAEEWMRHFYPDRFVPPPKEIIQIKGKANLAPKEEYLPFVQDFVRSGNWDRVGDLRNTGLITPDKVLSSETRKRLEAQGVQIPKYMTEQEAKELSKQAIRASDIPTLDQSAGGMKRGGSVHISDNPDTMALELQVGGIATARRAAAKAAEKAVPPKLPRAEPKTKAEIEAIAQRMAPQLTGEYVRKSPESAITVAGKTKRQFEREKELPVKLTGEERTPEQVGIESMKDKVAIGILGDPSITGRELESVGDIRLGLSSPQHGGPLYGMGRDEEFWASGKGAAQKVQNLAEEAGKQYDTDVLGKYIMMGPEGLNYALHFADANLQAIDTSKMTKRQIEEFNKLIRRGSPDSGPRPSFPGIEDKVDAYLQFAIDPKLRIHFNSLMQMPTVTEAFNLPSGQDIRFAITEPSLRDLERGVAGMSIGQMRPGAELTQSLHPTYEMDIPGKFMGSSKYPIPYELMFPDTVKAIRSNPRQAPHEFGSLGMVGPRQIIDQQMIDELKAYEEQIRKLTGKKKGGAVKKQAGGAIKAAVKAAKPTAEQAAKMAEQRAELVLRSRAMQELKDQFENLPQPPKGFLSSESILQRMDEIRRREATPSGEQIPLLKKGGAIEMQVGGALKAAAKAAAKAAETTKKVSTNAAPLTPLQSIQQGGYKIPPGGLSSEDKAALRPLYNQGLVKVEERGQEKFIVPGRGAWFEFATPEQKKALDQFQVAQNLKDLSFMGPTESLLNSAQASFYDFEISPGVRSIPIKMFEPFIGGYDSAHESKRIQDLTRAIQQSKQIEPLFVGLDPTGEPYIMEGQHRVRALKALGYDQIPARVVVDMDDITKAKGGAVSKRGGVKFTDNLDTMRLAVQKRK